MTAGDIANWLNDHGATGPAQQVNADAAEILMLIDDYLAGKTTFATSRFAVMVLGSKRQDPVIAYATAWPIFWLLVYAGGIALYLRIRRRQRAQQPAAYVP